MSNVRKFIQHNRAKNTNNSGNFIEFGNENILKNKSSLEAILKSAKSTGNLYLSNRYLTCIPDEVYNINNPEATKTETISFDSNDNSSWWNELFLTKLVLSSNLLETISNDISKLEHLTYLDLSDNKLIELNLNVFKLVNLKFLNVGKNKIKSIPEELGSLTKLQQFKCENNQITKLPSSIRYLTELQLLDCSYNKIQTTPLEMCFLISLVNINFSHNKLTEMNADLQRLNGLQSIDLSYNQIKVLSENLPSSLVTLNLNINQLTVFPIKFENQNLKELWISNNRIDSISELDYQNIPSIMTLIIANNKITQLPDNLSELLPKLVNFDVSNNELNNLPNCLGTMELLTGLSIDGNAFRAIKRTVVASGTEGIKRFLRTRDQQPIESANSTISTNQSSGYCAGIIGSTRNADFAKLFNNKHIDEQELRRTGIARLDNSSLSQFTVEMANCLMEASQNHLKSIILSRNKLVEFPISGLVILRETLTDLDLSNNSLKEIPDSINQLEKLQTLNLSFNRCTESGLPNTLSDLSNLMTLNLSNNHLNCASIPDIIYKLSGNLRHLLMSHCGLTVIEADKLRSLEVLDTLDLSNNDIGTVPPELGLCETLKNLNLEGNVFRVPRANEMAKGTQHLLEYLRSRIVR